MTTTQIYLNSLGCRLNEAELEQWARQFRSNGYHITADIGQADLMVLNTCAVTADAGRKSRQMIHRMQRHNPAARLVVSGCYTALGSERTAADLGVDLVIDNADKDRLVELTRTALSLPATPAAALDDDAQTLFARGRSRAFIKVQDGCRYRCTFCIVTVARGSERSRTVGDIVSEINHLHQQGIQEAILTGVHLGGYGSDIDSDLTTLIATILRETDIPRLRLGSLEPWDIPEHFFTLFDDPRLQPHLHLPLQSGNDNILRRMGRRCKTAGFTRLVEQLRAQIADFNLTTDVIVGFPGESDDDWRRTLDYIAATGFGHLHIFPYSPRSGTRAADMTDQLDRPTKRRRVAELHELAGVMKQQTMERFLNRTFPILWESKTAPQDNARLRYWGYTPNYLRVAVDVPAGEALAHRITGARLNAVDAAGEVIIGELTRDLSRTGTPRHPCPRP